MPGELSVHIDANPVVAHKSRGETDIPGFSELARMVGQTKEHYNDQM